MSKDDRVNEGDSSETSADTTEWIAYALSLMAPGDRAKWLLDQLERHKELYAARVGAERDHGYEAIHKYGQRVVLLLFGLNAGAIALIITLISNIQTESVPWSELVNAFSPAIYEFGGGVLLAVVTPAPGYFNAVAVVSSFRSPSSLFAWVRDLPEDSIHEERRQKSNRFVGDTQRAAIAAAVGSAIFFLLGLFLAMAANPPPP